jgi:catalase
MYINIIKIFFIKNELKFKNKNHAQKQLQKPFL